MDVRTVIILTLRQLHKGLREGIRRPRLAVLGVQDIHHIEHAIGGGGVGHDADQTDGANGQDREWGD